LKVLELWLNIIHSLSGLENYSHYFQDMLIATHISTILLRIIKRLLKKEERKKTEA
jgi:hypothetical protein